MRLLISLIIIFSSMATYSNELASMPGTMAIDYQVEDQKAHHCSATKISDNWILTAAHCLDDNENLEPKFSCNLSMAYEGKVFEGVKIKSIFIHPSATITRKLNDNKLRLYQDIALIELTEPITDIPTILVSTSKIEVNDVILTGGYGGQDCFLPQEDREQDNCHLRLFKKSVVHVSENHFWTQSSTSSPLLIQRGDSGGGVYKYNEKKNSWNTVGVNSMITADFGKKNILGRDGISIYGAHVRMDQVSKWLQDSMFGKSHPSHLCTDK